MQSWPWTFDKRKNWYEKYCSHASEFSSTFSPFPGREIVLHQLLVSGVAQTSQSLLFQVGIGDVSLEPISIARFFETFKRPVQELEPSFLKATGLCENLVNTLANEVSGTKTAFLDFFLSAGLYLAYPLSSMLMLHCALDFQNVYCALDSFCL